jgi:hypothetical protein
LLPLLLLLLLLQQRLLLHHHWQQHNLSTLQAWCNVACHVCCRCLVRADVLVGPVGTSARTDADFTLVCPYQATVRYMSFGYTIEKGTAWINLINRVECTPPVGITMSEYESAYGPLGFDNSAGIQADTQYGILWLYSSTRYVNVSQSANGTNAMTMRWLEGLQWITSSTEDYTQPQYGSATGPWTSLNCPPNYVVGGFYGRHIPAVGRITSLGVLCRPGEGVLRCAIAYGMLCCGMLCCAVPVRRAFN